MDRACWHEHIGGIVKEIPPGAVFPADEIENQPAKEPVKGERPVHEIRSGRIRAAIWKNQTVGGPLLTATFERLYRTESGEWRSSHSYSASELLELARVAENVHAYIRTQQQADEAGPVESV
jgi:hypothetical protein